MEKDIIELIPVEGHNSLGRDPNSNAIINTDLTAYESYKKARAQAKKKDRDLADLRSEVDQLKALVNTLVHKEDK